MQCITQHWYQLTQVVHCEVLRRVGYGCLTLTKKWATYRPPVYNKLGLTFSQ